ncbi:MAG: two-component system sensor histidine kinase LytS [Desulforhopalus sp.]|jgi:two-component system sensor histidine kinase LytS
MTITALITFLLKHVGLLVAGAFVLLTISPVQELNFKKNSIYNRLFLIIFFGLFGILGTYSGNAIFHSIANLRAMAVITAGLFGGPVVGFGAGLIAGGHRFVIDPWGFSAVACSLATILEGLFAGYMHLRYKERSLDWSKGMLLAFIGEMFHMSLVLAFSRPFEHAVALVQVIALPMIIGNTLGTGLFLHVIKNLQEFREKKDSTQAQKIFDIANNTVRYLRGGLNMETAQASANIIHQRLPLAAVAITDTTQVLAHVGAGDDHHLAGKAIRTKSTRDVLATGKPIFLRRHSKIGCNHADCPFYSMPSLFLLKRVTQL